MNTTYETSELTSSKTNMAPTTTFAKSKKGVVVLVALCMLFFYTGRLSSSTSGGGASLDASLLRGFQQDVVGGHPACAQGVAACPVRCERIIDACKIQYGNCLGDKACTKVLTAVSAGCGCESHQDCAQNIVDGSGHQDNPLVKAGIKCIDGVW